MGGGPLVGLWCWCAQRDLVHDVPGHQQLGHQSWHAIVADGDSGVRQIEGGENDAVSLSQAVPQGENAAAARCPLIVRAYCSDG